MCVVRWAIGQILWNNYRNHLIKPETATKQKLGTTLRWGIKLINQQYQTIWENHFAESTVNCSWVNFDVVIRVGFFLIQIELANLPNLPIISAKLKKNCGCQMVTHLSILLGADCLTSLIWQFTLTVLFVHSCLYSIEAFNWGIPLQKFTAHPSLKWLTFVPYVRCQMSMVRSMKLSNRHQGEY